MPFLDGIFFGLLLAIMLGPVFFALIHTSMNEGPFPGVAMAIGVSLSDTSYVFLCHLGVSLLHKNQNFETYLGIGGGLILLIYGLKMLINPISSKGTSAMVTRRSNFFKKMLKGYLINGINPSVLIFWLGVASMSAIKYSTNHYLAVIFYAGVLLTVFCTDLLKIYLAGKIRPLITARFITNLNRLAGVALIFYGLRLFYFALTSESIF